MGDKWLISSSCFFTLYSLLLDCGSPYHKREMEKMMDNVLFLFIFLLFMTLVALELAVQRWIFKNSDER